MLIRNIISKAEDVVSPEEWEELKKKPLPGDPARNFSQLFEVVDKTLMTKKSVPEGNVPQALKISTKKTDEAKAK
jgi:hypothetical protein